MSHNWKDDRAESEMRHAEETKMKEIRERLLANMKAVDDAKWAEFKKPLYVGDEIMDKHIDDVIETLRVKFHLSIKEIKNGDKV